MRSLFVIALIGTVCQIFTFLLWGRLLIKMGRREVGPKYGRKEPGNGVDADSWVLEEPSLD